MWQCFIKFYLKSLVHTTTFSLTSFPLTSFICLCVQHKLTSFLFTGALFKSWSCQLFNKKNCSKTRQGKFVQPHKQIKLVKKNSVVCAGLNNKNVQCMFPSFNSPRSIYRKTILILFKLCIIYNLWNTNHAKADIPSFGQKPKILKLRKTKY